MTKFDIKNYFEKIYNINVLRVNTRIQQGMLTVALLVLGWYTGGTHAVITGAQVKQRRYSLLEERRKSLTSRWLISHW